MDHFFKDIHGWFNFPNLYKEMVDRFPDNSNFVEIGTWKGQSAAYMAVEIVNSNKKINFYCVDTWDGFDSYNQYRNDEDVKQQTLYSCFLDNIKTVQDVIIPIRQKSLQAATTFKDKSVDFIFIDASHDYKDVKEDIKAWFPKLKQSGILAGHDYQSHCPGVIKAVHEFSEQQKIPLVTQGMCWRFNLEL